MALEEPKLDAGLDASGLVNGFVPLPGRFKDAVSLSPNGVRLLSVFGVPDRIGVGLTVVVADGSGWP